MAKPVRPVAPPRALRSDPATFSANAEGEITYQFDTLPNWMDTLGDFVDLKADEANAAALGGAAIPVPEKSGQALIVNAAGDGLAYAGFLAGFRNAIINGNFDHWQRGTSFSANEYGADRWVHSVVGASGSVVQSRQAFAVGQTDVPNEPTYFYRISGGSYAMTSGNVTQRIEDVRSFAGQTVTLSFYAKALAARDIRPRFVQVFDGSANVSTAASPVSLTTSWQKFTATVSIPSIAGKTVGANSRLELVFDIKEGAFGSDLGNNRIDIAQVQLEAGSVATPFERRPVGTELALCQRYFQTVGRLLGIWSAGSKIRVLGPLAVWMRAHPTAALTTTSLTAEKYSVATHSTTTASIEANLSTLKNVEVIIDGFATFNVPNDTAYLGDIDVIALDAEI